VPNVAASTSHSIATTLSYDAKGNLASAADTTGHVTTLVRDALGRVTGTSDGTASSTMAFDDGNRLTAVTDARGNATSFGYTMMPCGCTEGSRVTSMRTPDLAPGQQWSYEYGTEGRLEKVTNLKGDSESYAYTPTGELAAVVDALSRTTRTTYDQLGRPSTMTDALGRVRRQGYAVPTAAGWASTSLLAGGPDTAPPDGTLTSTLGNGQYQVGASAFTSMTSGPRCCALSCGGLGVGCR